jgi:hypothetical protein
MSSNEELISAKENYLQTLTNQYKALYQQLSGNLSEADKVSIKEQIDHKQEEIQKVSAEIDALRQTGAPGNKAYRAYSLQWEEHFPKINFSRSKKIIDDVFKPFEDQRGAALFLLQQNRSMRGDLCIQHIKSVLQSLGTWQAPATFEFMPHRPTNPSDFLKSLASRFEIQSIAEDPTLMEVIRGICQSLQSGNVLLIQVEVYCVDPRDNFLVWFIQQFWQPLINEVAVLDQERPLIRVVSVISVGNIVPRECLPAELCCTTKKFHPQKLLELPLQKWTEKEICTWLFKFSNLTAVGLKRSDIETMAKNIYLVSEGRPSEVYSELMHVMTQKVS